MIIRKNKKHHTVNSVYTGRYFLKKFLVDKFNHQGMEALVAKQLIQDELNLEGKPILNLASFVTTWMEPEANDLIMQSINKNVIDSDEYPQIQKIHARCVHMLADLLHITKEHDYAGTATVGSSEAILLACLAHKFTWRNHRRAQGKDTSKPNIIMGGNVHVCWEKFARYFDVEPRIVPLEEEQYFLKAKDVGPLIDENTICVGVILGSTYTGEYDEVAEINALLLRVKQEQGWDIPMHVDAASGGFILMFKDHDIQWDFRLEQVKSINLSGHKYGLVYPGIGWLVFKDQHMVPEELIFNINYLGGLIPSYTLNFSNSSAMIVAQYYNFLRLGQEGYRKIVHNMMKITEYIVKGLEATGYLKIVGTRRMEPVITMQLVPGTSFSVFEFSKALRCYDWIVPAYTMPKNVEHLEVMRIVVKENMSLSLAEDFLGAVNKVFKEFEGKPSVLTQKRDGKNLA